MSLFFRADGKEMDVNSRALVGFFVEKRRDAPAVVAGEAREGRMGMQGRLWLWWEKVE